MCPGNPTAERLADAIRRADLHLHSGDLDLLIQRATVELRKRLEAEEELAAHRLKTLDRFRADRKTAERELENALNMMADCGPRQIANAARWEALVEMFNTNEGVITIVLDEGVVHLQANDIYAGPTLDAAMDAVRKKREE